MRIADGWVEQAGLDPAADGAHATRRANRPDLSAGESLRGAVQRR